MRLGFDEMAENQTKMDKTALKGANIAKFSVSSGGWVLETSRAKQACPNT